MSALTIHDDWPEVLGAHFQTVLSVRLPERPSVELAFIAVVLPPLAWASRPGRLPHLPQILSVVVAAAGMVWLVERLFFPT